MDPDPMSGEGIGFNCTAARDASGHDLVARYIAAAQSENTRKAYRSDLRDFEAWGGAVPTTSNEVARYIAERAQMLRPSTLRRRLAAVATAHRDRGAMDPTKAPLVGRVMAGIERTHGCSVRQASPLNIPELYRVIQGIDQTPQGLRDRAILLIGFFGALRRSEIASLNLADLEFSQLGIRVMIRRSKTDQGGWGRLVVVPSRSDALCPAHALEAWIRVRVGPGTRLFYRLDQAGMSTLHPGTVSDIVKARVGAVGLQASAVSAHSLRAGLVTSAMLARVDNALIPKQTGHRSLQSLAIYVRPAIGLALPEIG
jgi:integrase